MSGNAETEAIWDQDNALNERGRTEEETSWRSGKEIVDAVREEKKDSETATPTTDEEWRQTLTAEQYYVCRMKGTEPPFSGKYNSNKADGSYLCVACGSELFSSDTKFDSGTGWPSFWAPVEKERVAMETDDSYGMRRVEVLCGGCGSHLGHVFDDGPRPTGLRFCINSLALDFKK